MLESAQTKTLDTREYLNYEISYRHIITRSGVKDIASEAILKTANGNADLGNNKLQSLYG